ncbi:unnamed protein product [Prunus armeniaca]
MEWLVVCIVLAIGFHSKPTKRLLPQYYDVPQVLDSIRYRMVHEIGQLSPNQPNDSSHDIMMFPKYWTQSDFDWSMKSDNSGSYDFVLKWIGRCIAQFSPLDFTPNQPNDCSHDIMMFPKIWTQSDFDWSLKSDNSGSYDVRSEMEWLAECIVLDIGFKSKPTKSLLP